MPAVVISPEALRHKPGNHIDLLQRANFEIRYPKNPHFARGLCDIPETIRELYDAEAVIAGAEIFSASVIESLPKLRVIARAGVGYDRVDVTSATARGIAITITPNSNHEAVAEHALALMFAVAKSIAANDRMVRHGGWSRELPQPIRGRTLGIWGLGRIGRSLAVRAQASGMKVIATDEHPDATFIETHRVELVDFDTLLAESDVLSLHCPLNEKTRNAFDILTLSKMKSGSVLINTARGGLIVESALLEVLSWGHLAGAGLDVFQQEPPPSDHPLFALPNVVFSPHLAGTDQLSMQEMANEASQSIVDLFQGRFPRAVVVNPQVEERWNTSANR